MDTCYLESFKTFGRQAVKTQNWEPQSISKSAAPDGFMAYMEKQADVR